jgi:hypothetical protein
MGQSMSIFPNVHLFESEHHLKRTWQARVLHLLRLNPEWPMWPSLANDSVRNGVYLSHHWFYITIRYNPINQLTHAIPKGNRSQEKHKLSKISKVASACTCGRRHWSRRNPHWSLLRGLRHVQTSIEFCCVISHTVLKHS